MKLPSYNLLIVLLLIVLLSLSTAEAEEKLLRRKEALVIAEQTPEAVAMYQLNEGKFVNCIEKSVMKPCDTDWVTCVDDAWVVKFHFGDICGFKNDGRMDLVILVDAKDGRIISKYPEAPYFTNPQYCINTNDCISIKNQEADQCFNFVYSQLKDHQSSSKQCECQSNVCVTTEQK